MKTKLFRVAQHRWGISHIAEQGSEFTLCGLRLRETAAWGEEVPESGEGENERLEDCKRCRHNAFSGGRYR